MTTVAEFSTIEVLPSGQRVEIRALTPADREDMLAAVGRTSTQSNTVVSSMCDAILAKLKFRSF